MIESLVIEVMVPVGVRAVRSSVRVDWLQRVMAFLSRGVSRKLGGRGRAERDVVDTLTPAVCHAYAKTLK